MQTVEKQNKRYYRPPEEIKTDKRKKGRMPFYKKVLIVFIVTLLLTIAACGIGLCLLVKPYTKYKDRAQQIISETSTDDFKEYLTTHIYDKDENVIATLSDGEGRSVYLEYDEIPENVIHAFIAVEDRTFYENKGYDLKGIVRVLWRYVSTKGAVEAGASTITQQLVREKYLTTEKSIGRKLTEIFCAAEMTKMYSKNEIMEFYVNDCYFANGLYGIEAASEYYFSKKASELTLSQTAYLCAIPNRPSYYDPCSDSTHALKRRDKILRAMRDCGFITEKECSDAMAEEITLDLKESPELHNYQTTYAVHCACEELMRHEGFAFTYQFDSDSAYESYQETYSKAYKEAKEKLYEGGYEIHTSLSPTAQKKAQKALDEVVTDQEKEEDGTYSLQGASTVISNKTGKVIAVVGGRTQDTESYTYNRAYQSYRQPGSSIKPLIVYTPALEKGYNAEYELTNIDVTAAKEEKDADVSSMKGEKMKLSYAVEHSINGCAYQLFDNIGIDYGLSFLNTMQFRKIVPDDHTLSSALGGLTYGATTVEMASAYAALENNGVYRAPTCITSITDETGSELYEEQKEEQVYDKLSSEKMVSILKGVITDGTASGTDWYDSCETEAAGKTGTTNGNKDGWFCGMTPYFTISVWVGYDTPASNPDLTGSSYPLNIWKKTMLAMVKGKDKKEFDTSEIKKNAEETSDEKYLPGRNDDELLSSGYTVGDYRKDHTNGEAAEYAIEQMKTASSISELDSLLESGNKSADSVTGKTYRTDLKDRLESAYAGRKEQLRKASSETGQREGSEASEKTGGEDSGDNKDNESITVLPEEEDDDGTNTQDEYNAETVIPEEDSDITMITE